MSNKSNHRTVSNTNSEIDCIKPSWNIRNKIAILSIAMLVATIPGSVHAESEGLALSNPITVDMSGHQKDGLHIGEPVGFSSVISNHGAKEQRFTYVVQVLDQNNQVQSSSGMSSNIYPTQSLTISESWTPQKEGTYSVETYLLNGDLIQSPATGIIKTTVIVD